MGARHAQQCGRQRKGDLVLDHLRGLPRVLGVDDDLRVGKIGNGVERHLAHGIDAGGGEQRRADQHENHIAGRPADDGGDHGWLPCERSGAAAEDGGCAAGAGVAAMGEKADSAALRLLSASMRKFAATTTSSPASMPEVTSV